MPDRPKYGAKQGASTKRKWDTATLQHGSRNKKGDMGRKDFSRSARDRRAQNSEEANKRRKVTDEDRAPALPKPFSEEEVAAEERRPKHKVAVMLGYSGTGYKGMQINTHEKTIEGDLFAAFIAAGAISKANANDPKKSQLVRCARTDKGVHAAGNVISLKLIVEDKDVVKKINAALSPQIRVWGINRTVNSFSAYQACDSRWYEYMIPTHSFIPAHPSSWLAKRLVELADDADDRDGYDARQKEVSNFWTETEEKYIKPILDELPEDIRSKVHEALYVAGVDAQEPQAESKTAVDSVVQMAEEPKQQDEPADEGTSEDIASNSSDGGVNLRKEMSEERPASPPPVTKETPLTAQNEADSAPKPESIIPGASLAEKRALEAAIKQLRTAYKTAKRAYRITPARLERIQPILDLFLGTRNFHNYTIQKTFRDPSAKRVIKSFKVNPTPIVIDGTEWLSIKIHGQSFMMHQIRKMVGMIALVIRSGCDSKRITESFTDVNASIPKSPSLGLLLERPVFNSYNEGAAKKFSRQELDFSPYEKEMEEFKQREIYERVYREENEENAFHQFFAHVDNYKEAQFWYLSSMGFKAVKEEQARKGADAGGGKEAAKQVAVDSDDEETNVGDQEG